jgi:hypothetical protein
MALLGVKSVIPLAGWRIWDAWDASFIILTLSYYCSFPVRLRARNLIGRPKRPRFFSLNIRLANRRIRRPRIYLSRRI